MAVTASNSVRLLMISWLLAVYSDDSASPCRQWQCRVVSYSMSIGCSWFNYMYMAFAQLSCFDLKWITEV
jgi:hypothetical protein